MYMNANNDSLEKTGAGKYWRQKEKITEDEMIGWHHQFNGHELRQTLGYGKGQGGLACYSPWGVAKSQTWLGDWIATRNVHERDSEMLACKMSIKGKWERRTDQIIIKLEAQGGTFVGFNRKRVIIDNWITSGRMLEGWIWHDIFDGQELGE